MFKRILSLIIVFIIIVSFVPISSFGEKDIVYDIVIQNGNIYNPSTDHELIGYNLGITGSKITRITKESIEGKKVIDATNLVVSPGFVDLISYDPNSVGIRLKVLDGVTTNLAMHGGTEDAESWYRAWGKNGVLTNYGASTFITRLRWPIVGGSVDAELKTKEQIDKLVSSVKKNIENGTLGISFSFEYIPGVKNEIIPLLKLAKEYNVPTFYHLRYSDEERGLEGIQEVIDYAKETGAIIHIMHINSTGGTFVMDKALDMVKDANNEGLDVTSCFYPYDYWATYLGSARFRGNWQDRFKVTYEDLQIGGTDIRVTKDTFDKYRAQNVLVAAHGSMPEEELIMLLKDPNTMIGSDTIIEPHFNNHPRGSGTYSRVFGKYVREEKVLTMMDAIKKVSYFPAIRMEDASPSMKYKGRIEIGADADITIFNPETIIDKATVKDTALPSEGVEYVIINGVITKDLDGIVKGVNAGKPIKSYFVDKTKDNETISYIISLESKDPESLQKAYNIDEKIYLPIDEVSEYLGLDFETNINGQINIENSLSLEIGNSKASFRDKIILLNNEPIIYKGGVYISEDDLISILEISYNIDQSEGQIQFTKIEDEEVIEAFSPSNDDIIKEGEIPNNDTTKEKESKNPIIMVYSISAVLILLVLLLFKGKR